jgi:hypothetical protein
MLQGAAAAMAEMGTSGIGAPRPGSEPFYDPALASSASAGAEPRANAVTRHRKGQKDRLAFVFRDAVSLGTKPLDRKLDEPIRRFSALSLDAHSL